MAAKNRKNAGTMKTVSRTMVACGLAPGYTQFRNGMTRDSGLPGFENSSNF
jgi:hypothetical protein